MLSLFGATSLTSSPLVSAASSVCSALHIPFFSVSPDESPPSPSNTAKDSPSAYLVRLGPSRRQLAEAVRDLVVRMGWKRVALVTHRETGQEGKKEGRERRKG